MLSWLRGLILQVQICGFFVFVCCLKCLCSQMNILEDAQNLEDFDVQEVPCPREVLPRCNYCRYSIYDKIYQINKSAGGFLTVNHRLKIHF